MPLLPPGQQPHRPSPIPATEARIDSVAADSSEHVTSIALTDEETPLEPLDIVLDRDGPVEESDDYDEEEYDDYEEDWDLETELDSGINQVMDQDWADASGGTSTCRRSQRCGGFLFLPLMNEHFDSADFTKRYNRLKQHVVASSASNKTFGATYSSGGSSTTSNILPAINRPKRVTSYTDRTTPFSATSSGTPGVHTDKVSDQLATLNHRFASKLDLDPILNRSANVGVTRKGGSEKVLVKDKSDRATNEQVLDPRTRLILFKMLGRGLIERVDGCVSTGKEANVYHAVSPAAGMMEEGKDGEVQKDLEEEKGEGSIRFAEETSVAVTRTMTMTTTTTLPPNTPRHLALKIYKTSILIFKDRDRYVSGEFRFKSGYARSNPRKMVRLWAEKEMRNLRRMKNAGLNVPEPIEVRENVLVMEFMGVQEGEDEWQASPRLKDADIPFSALPDLYLDTLVILRILFQKCKLVHADFSEYNVLYHRSQLVIIDVSQSVEQDHPSAFDFLRSDLKNVEEFYGRKGVGTTLGLRGSFGFVTRGFEGVGEETEEGMREEARRLLSVREGQLEREEEEESTTRANDPTSFDALIQVDEAVFAQSFIPRALDQVYDIERDVARVLRGEGDDLIYADLTGVARIREKEKKAAADADAEGGQGVEGRKGEEGDGSGSALEDSDSDGDSDDDEDEEEEEGTPRPKGKKFEDKDEKKKRRAEVKAANRDKRSQKMKKSEKARKVRKTSGKK
ncbi:BZ3500_MvSof-1268-A1-R1_Chr10-1g02730 [Microbotryum saponariae]|uniref:non-specific serine/threonine protein kinase n=1 Tax=Microbotryum saponariae TaxID=289078 RepID=A0A2X0LK21_9BASI|nr:BZ3500_MvSof-1268-A1-R1_Chr10-1g02730 [Microbotryum saponariae]SDA06219.1 BZ3501_MvSof-1269-A2-R1_Chr10-1g02331 [Microbotryum saponariae]